MMNAEFSLKAPATQFKLKLADQPKPAMTLTEKHRPRDLASVVGQGEVTFRMEAFLEAPYSSAWFFDGPTGVGKTTVALAVAAELGAVEFGGLDQIKSGMQDAEAVEKSLNELRYTPMLGSGWKVIIVDEADYMSHKASQLWLSALEDLPAKSVVIFTTNNPAKFPDRFLDRCERITFASIAEEHKGDAQDLVNRVWMAETGSLHGSPHAQDLKNIVDQDGAISYRRVVRALEPLLAIRNARKTADTVNIEAADALAKACDTIFAPIAVKPESIAAGRPRTSRAADHAGLCDWAAMAERFLSGEKLTALARELGVDVKVVDYHVTRMGGTSANRKSRRENQATAG